MKQEMKLTGKDLINIGIYTAILFVLNFVAMFAGIVPFLWTILPGTAALLTAIPFAMMNLKVKKPGAIPIMGAIVALIYFVTGQFTVLLLITFVRPNRNLCIPGNIKYHPDRSWRWTAWLFLLLLVWHGKRYLTRQC